MKTKKAVTLILSAVLIAGITFLGGLCMSVRQVWLRILLLASVNLSIGFVAVIAMKITDMKPDLDFANLKQYLIGAIIALSLSLTIAFLPALFGFSLVGGHQSFSLFGVIYNFLNCFLIIGPVEEIVFRVYIQETMVSFFDKNKYNGNNTYSNKDGPFTANFTSDNTASRIANDTTNATNNCVDHRIAGVSL